MYKSEFNWTPTPYNAPCYKGHVCKHKAETQGVCRRTCSDYKVFESLKDVQRAEKKSAYVHNEYKQQSMIKQQRRYG